MAKISNRALDATIRKVYMSLVTTWLTEMGEQVLQTGANELCLPVVDGEGNEKFLQIVFKVPQGDRDSKEPYDGYAAEESYQLKLKEKEEKTKAREQKVAASRAKKEKAKTE